MQPPGPSSASPASATAVAAPCPICHNIGWVCEAHPFVAVDRGGECCGAGAMACDCNPNGIPPPDFVSIKSVYGNSRGDQD